MNKSDQGRLIRQKTSYCHKCIASQRRDSKDMEEEKKEEKEAIIQGPVRVYPRRAPLKI